MVKWLREVWDRRLGALVYMVWIVMTVFRLRIQLYISNRHSYLHLYCPLIYAYYLLSQMERGIHTLALNTPCMLCTE